MKRAMLPLLTLALLTAASGCSSLLSYPGRTRAAREAFARLDFPAAAADLSSGCETRLDSLCFLLERGMVRHTAGDYAASIQDFARADRIVRQYEDKAVISASDTAASLGGLIVNDRLRPYRGAGFEKTLLHTFMAIDYLMRRDLEDARVEAKQAWQLQAREAERHEAAVKDAEAAARKQNLGADSAVATVRANYQQQRELLKRAGNIYQNAFTAYVSSLVYELNGEPNDAYVDLKMVYRLAPQFTPAHGALLRLSRQLHIDEDAARWQRAFGNAGLVPGANEGEVVVLFECGQAPVKEDIRVRLPLPRGYATLVFPRYQLQSNPVARAALALGGRRLGETQPLYDVEAAAVKDLWNQLPVIVIRELIRATAKAAAVNEMSRRTANKNGVLSGAVVGLVGSLAADISEQADLRSWLLLPATLQAARVSVPAGEHEFTLDLLTPGGGRIGAVTVHARVEAGRTTILLVRSVGTLAVAHVATLP